MATGLRPLKPQKLLKALALLGFAVVRQHGSHVILRHPDGRITVVPYHSGREIDRHLIRKILRQIEMEPEDFLKLI
ncbi:MAG: type II toxin-antitoxin system HicA family toxin [Candidatus Micrarchaeota archaeon]